VDHRLQDMAQTDNTDCLIPSDYIGLSTQMDFAKSFKQLAHGRGVKWQRDTHIQICRRHIDVIQVTQEEPQTAPSIVWFDFHALCDGPRSQLDYMEIAQQFAIVMISNVPAPGERVVNYSKNDNKARRFISLIDELYDQNVMLYLSCDVPLTELYLDGALIFEFRRTYSRLVEMSRGPAQIPSSHALSN
jgi:cell division protein ZapE